MMTKTKSKPKPVVTDAVHIRWMIRKDMPEVYGIENANYEFPWSENDFVRCLRQRNCIAMVAEQGEKVCGYMVYELHKNRIHILNIAVHASCHGSGIGRSMIAKLISKLSTQRRSRLMCEVRESNLDAQLFFRAMGFRAISILKDFYWDAPGAAAEEDAYLMQFRYVPGDQ